MINALEFELDDKLDRLRSLFIITFGDSILVVLSLRFCNHDHDAMLLRRL